MAAVISRLQASLNSAAANGNGHAQELKRDLLVGKAFCHRAASTIRQRLKALTSNGDEELLRVADAVLGTA